MYVLSSVNYKTTFVLKYIFFAIMIGLFVLFIKGLILNKIVITKNETKATLKIKILTGCSILFVLIGSFLYIGTVWFIDFFGKLTPEQFLFNFNSPVTGTASNVMDQAINGPVLLLVSILVGFIFLMLTKFK